MLEPEIVLPVTSPETEWIRGRARVKLSSTRDHARIQLRLGSALDAWAGERGEVGTEWRFRIAPAGEPRRPLVPDIAFVAREQLRDRSREDLAAPDFAPTVAVEVLSPGDSAADIADKVAVYLRGGSRLAVVVDPQSRTVDLYDANGTRHLSGNDALEHGALPGFRLQLDAFFSDALDLRR